MLGVIAAILALLYFRTYPTPGIIAAMVIVAIYIAAIALPEVLFLRTPWRDSVGLDFSRWQPSTGRIAVKLSGLYGTLGLIALLYWLFPEYHGSFYQPFYEAMGMVGPALLVASVPYVIFMDGYAKAPHDSYYSFGKWLLLDGKNIKRIIIAQHVLGWVVKGFFLPLMFVSFVGNVNHLSNADFSEYFSDFQTFFKLSTSILFSLDLLVAVAGYAFTMRLFDSHIRSSEPTLFGWLICTMCYQPFLNAYMRLYLPYSSNDWLSWLNDSPELQMVWGFFALVALLVYTLTSVNFGLRFSNLTHRGVLTKGMYRFTKHPAYVSKNIFWWLTFIPFIPMNGWIDAVRYSLLMCGISAVYFLRARTEEAHLSCDPAYVEYALYMNQHSIFSGLARLFPILRYKAPEGWQKQTRPYGGILS